MSIFVFDIKNGSETQFDVGKTAVKRLKTLRHPSILTYLDSFEVRNEPSLLQCNVKCYACTHIICLLFEFPV